MLGLYRELLDREKGQLLEFSRNQPVNSAISSVTENNWKPYTPRLKIPIVAKMDTSIAFVFATLNQQP